MVLNQIGSQQFITLEGPVPPYAEVVERIAYTGVDGASYRKIGKTSGQFRLQSRVNVASISSGRTKLDAYTALIGGGLQQIIHNGKNFDSDNLKVIVVAVQLVTLRMIVQWSGSFNDTDQAELVCDWTLEFRKV